MRAWIAALALLAGCLPPQMFPQPPGVIFEDSNGPIAYRADLRHGSREVRGETCRRGIAVPTPWSFTAAVAWGDDSWREALRKAEEQAGGAALSDVRADVHRFGVLIWREECLVVTAMAE